MLTQNVVTYDAADVRNLGHGHEMKRPDTTAREANMHERRKKPHFDKKAVIDFLHYDSGRGLTLGRLQVL